MLGLDRLFLGFPVVLGLGCAISQNVTPIDRSGIELHVIDLG